MKNTGILVTFLALIAALTMVGCKGEEINSGTDSSKPVPENLRIDESVMSEGVIGVVWDAKKAVAAGAASFTVQLSPDAETGSNYSADKRFKNLTLKISDDIYDAATFSGIEPYSPLFVRVRANYPRSVFSDWVYLGLNGKTLPYESGIGFIDSTLVGIKDLSYSVEKSSPTSMGFDFNADDALNAGATTLRFQIVNNITGAVEMTQALVPPLTESGVLFSELKNGTAYKVRSRAEYASEDGVANACSAWMWAKTDSTSMFRVGTGPEVERFVAPTTKLLRASSSTLTFSWSESDFTSVSKDLSRPLSAALYRDQQCSDLVVSWDFGVNNSIFGGKAPAFIFTGLQQNSTYYLVVTDMESKLSSEPLAATTETFEVVTVGSGKVAAGEVAVAEDFSELVWGGDYLFGAAGYSNEGRSSATAMTPASGVNPVSAGGYYLVPSSTEIGLFNTLKKSVPSTRHLKNWGIITEGGSKGGIICARAGYAKLGAAKLIGLIVTPVLSNLSGTATVELSFKGCLYGSDPTTAAVEIVNGASFGTIGETSINEVSGTRVPVESFTLESGGWKDYHFELTNVSPTSAIAIGPTREGVSGQHRMYIDDIVVKVKSYGGTVIEIAKPVITAAEAGSDKISLAWNKVDNATEYQVEYKKSSDAAFAQAGSTTELTYALTGLDPQTSYDVRIIAVAGEYKGDYSDVKTVSTTEAPKQLVQKARYISATQVGVAWSFTDFKDNATDNADDYTVALYKDAACADLLISWTVAADKKMWEWYHNQTFGTGPSWLFPGLTPSTDYWVKVTNTTKNLSSVGKYTTEASKVVTVPSSPAKAGDVVLYEDFGQFLWGGETVRLFPGFSSYTRSKDTELKNAAGEDPQSTDGKTGFYLVKTNTHMGLFSTLKNAIPTTRLETWADWMEKDQHKAMCIENGCVKVGASKLTGDIVTPELVCLSGKATVEVQFDAAPYVEGSNEAWDALNGRVDVFDGATVSSYTLPVATAPVQTKEWTLARKYEWQHFTVTLSGVTATSRIGIGAFRKDGAIGKTQARMYLDNIQIKVVKYE